MELKNSVVRFMHVFLFVFFNELLFSLAVKDVIVAPPTERYKSPPKCIGSLVPVKGTKCIPPENESLEELLTEFTTQEFEIWKLNYRLETRGPVEYEGPNDVVEGEGFSISCRLTQFDALKWLKDNEQIEELQHSIIDSRNQYVLDAREENGLIVASISVKSALSNHSGTYRCSSLSNESHNLYVLGGNEVRGSAEVKILKQMGDLELTCDNPLNSDYPDPTVKWTKDNATLENNANIKIDKTKVFIHRGTDEQAGNYTCEILSKNQTVFTKPIEVLTEPFVKLPNYVNVVEEEKLKIECIVLGKPKPIVKWKFNNTIYQQATERVKLAEDKDRHVPNAVFTVNSAMVGDKGVYSCIAVNPRIPLLNETTTTTTVYVKGKLDALWPFLGIVAEVVVLCAIILIYEKKRNNNAELEESDTDQSPDQKNTPDHGKDTVRHRK